MNCPSENFRDLVIGADVKIPLFDGTQREYINFDNAATTPPFKCVIEMLHSFMPYYSSIHRGSGFKSRVSTEMYEKCRHIIASFVKADLATNTVIFCRNTTEAINKLAVKYPFTKDSVILTTMMEHHSNDLPWRGKAHLKHVKVTKEGRLNEEDLDLKFKEFGERIDLIVVSGASNVTGYINPVHKIARKAHNVGAKILVDAAQMASHYPIDMKPESDPEHLDFVAISGHKMYAPFGTGVLIGSKKVFEGIPVFSGGGTVEAVTLDEVFWKGPPENEEAGTPNVLGVMAMAAAAKKIMSIGIENILAHEKKLTSLLLGKLRKIPEVIIYGPNEIHDNEESIGVVSFNVKGVSHFKVAAVLGHEGGIGVRSGCFCAHPYVIYLLGISKDEQKIWRDQIISGNKLNMPGMVRVGFGCYNTESEVEHFINILKKIIKGDYQCKYVQEAKTGEFYPENYDDVPIKFM